jgi:peptidoglycan hydrolase-like protein with peptidoglycan-binding domain
MTMIRRRFASFLNTGIVAGVLATLGTVLPAGSTAAPTTAAIHAAPSPSAHLAVLQHPLRYKMESPQVRELQIRLRHAKYLAAYDANDRFGQQTRAAVEKFQRDHDLKPTGVVDQKTWDVLLAKSRAPTAAELDNTDVGAWFTSPTQAAIAAYRRKVGLPASDVMDERTWARLIGETRSPRYAQLFDAPPASTLTQALDTRCLTGKVVCISKRQKKMSYVVNGQAQLTRAARFSRPGYDSPVGEFRIWYMNQDTISKIFGERTPMPYAIFYLGNVAIHYSDDFARTGYASGSHGCSQLNDYQSAKWLYEQVKVGDRVVVYD